MRSITKLLFAAAMGCALLPGAHANTAAADAAKALDTLRSAVAPIALMRHADAPGIGDPPDWRLDDCATQRNLSARGRDDARAAGERLRAERVRPARVISSPWCRCKDTATLMALGPVQVEPAFSNAFVLRERSASLEREARALLAGWRGPGPLLVVTHGANIQALTGYSPASGEIVVVESAPADAAGAMRVVGTIAAR